MLIRIRQKNGRRRVKQSCDKGYNCDNDGEEDDHDEGEDDDYLPP